MQTQYSTPAPAVSRDDSPTLAQAAQAGYDEALSFLERYVSVRAKQSTDGLVSYDVTCVLAYVRGARPGTFAADYIARGAA